MRDRAERRLVAIMAVDVVGYSRLMGADEEGTLAALKAIRRELVDPRIVEHRGRIVKTTGDGLLVEFASIVDAVRCAVEVQREMAERNTDVPAETRIEFRVGINLGDIIIDGDDIFGDGVNVAARLETLAEPGGICVSRVVRDQVRDKLPFAFEDMGEQQVKNIARPVRVFRVQMTAAAPEPKPALALPDKPSLAVLPFQNMSGDPEQEYFADGMVEEIITALSRIKWLFVIARNSTFTYKGQSVDVKQVGRELGVRYVLEGSVRKGGNRVRITAQMIEAETGAHLWADRFDGSLEDIFDLQDTVAAAVAGVIEPKLRVAATERSRRKPTESLDAYDCFLRAAPLVWAMTREANAEALSLTRRAIALDPTYASAYALAAQCYVFRRTMNWEDSLDEGAAEGARLAKKAVDLAGDDSTALYMAGQALAYLAREYDAALVAMERSLALSPSSAAAHAYCGWVHVYRGEGAQALDRFRDALRLSPYDDMALLFHSGIARAYLVEKKYEEAVAAARRPLQGNAHWAGTWRILAASYAHLGQLDEARDAVQRLLQIDPDLTVTKAKELMGMRDNVDAAHLIEGLRLAGLPE